MKAICEAGAKVVIRGKRLKKMAGLETQNELSRGRGVEIAARNERSDRAAKGIFLPTGLTDHARAIT